MILEISSCADDILRLFGIIQYMLINANRVIYYVYKAVDAVRFVRHIHAFEVVETKVWACIRHEKLISCFPNSIHYMADGKYYVPCT